MLSFQPDSTNLHAKTEVISCLKFMAYIICFCLFLFFVLPIKFLRKKFVSSQNIIFLFPCSIFLLQDSQTLLTLLLALFLFLDINVSNILVIIVELKVSCSPGKISFFCISFTFFKGIFQKKKLFDINFFTFVVCILHLSHITHCLFSFLFC